MSALLLMAAILSPPALAEEAEVRVTLPNALAKAPLQAEKPLPVPPSKGVRLSAEIGSWIPREIALEGRLSGTTPFTRSQLPYSSAALLVPVPWSDTIQLRVGAGIAGLARTGILRLPGSDEPLSQQGWLIPLEAGLQLKPSSLKSRIASLHLGASVLPSVLLLAPSPLGDGRSVFGLGFAGSLGADFPLGALWGESLELGARILATGGGGELKLGGVGVQAGLSFQL